MKGTVGAGVPRPRARGRRRRLPRLRFGAWVALSMVLLVSAYVGMLSYLRPHVSGETLSLTTFVAEVQRGDVRNATVLDVDSYLVGDYVRDGATRQYNVPLLTRDRPFIGTPFGDLLVGRNIPTTVDQQSLKNVVQLGAFLFPGLILILLFVYLIISYRRGSGLFEIGSRARKIGAEQGGATFADVAGQERAIAELREVVDFLRDPERFTRLGARMPKGVLLFGPPGCGKTLLARALAGEAGANFYSISGSDFLEVYVGVGAARVRGLFKTARENAPAIIFIDELDLVGRARSDRASARAGGEGSNEQEQTLTQILTQLDGFSPSEGIILVGATNRPDVLDQGLLRPGRIDRTIALERPNEEAREQILQLHARGKGLADDVDLASVARRSIGLTGADMANVINEGALLAARGNRPSIGQEELNTALQTILEAPERQRRLSLKERSIGRRFSSADRVTFGDVAGVDSAVAELAEVREYLAEPERFARLGARVPRGILLAGPPGCGKTLLARAVAGEANAAFFSTSASEFNEIYTGEGAARVRDLFAEAKSMPPAIIFIDEIDAIGRERSSSAWSGNERESTLNQILVEMDGFDAGGGITVIAATNRADVLDSALVRPGRFDRRVTIELPDRAGREAILNLHARGKRLAADVDLNRLAGMTSGSSGADLAGVLNEAALLAARRGLTEISMALVEEGAERAALGVNSRNLVMSERERKMVAYHEVGHALVGRALPGASSPRKLSIIPRGNSLGQTWHVADEADRNLYSKSDYMDTLAALLGGRAAEELVFEDPGSGSSGDLTRVSVIARRMVTELGMSEALGAVTYPLMTGADGRPVEYSEEAEQRIDREVSALIGRAYASAREVLEGSLPDLHRAAAALQRSETLDAEELERVIGDKSAA